LLLFLVIGGDYINSIIQTNDLSFYNEYGVLTVNAKQFETKRRFAFDIIDNDEPYDLTGCKVSLRIAKADGKQFLGTDCCTKENNTIIVDTSIGNGNQILTASGINRCELHLEDESGCLSTWTFNIYVEPRVHNGENLTSIDSYDVIDRIILSEKERIENEKIRKDNEIQRIENEEIRKSNEIIRVTSELERQLNESERKKTFADVLNKAQTYATTASVCAFNASNSEKNAHNSAIDAESWAHGKTGTREDEDTNNAEFFAKLSEQNAAKSGWMSFAIDEKTGHLMMRKRGVDDISFALVNGRLEVTLG